MAKGPRYRVPYRRRRQNKTDYKARRILATSEHPRFVVRISNQSILVQLVKSEIEGDYILTQVSSKDLFKYGWVASGKNVSAAYLIGLIIGKKVLEKGIDTAYLDIGLKKATKGSKVFAVVKGAIDSGLNIPFDSEIIPPPQKINGNIFSEYAKNIEDPIKYEKLFSVYLKRGLQPETLNHHFEEIKARIEEEKYE